MYESFGNVTLKNGQVVEAGVVTAPDADWSPTVRKLLGHKPSPWNWHIEQTLLQPLGVTNRFYVLHRDGAAFSNIMTSVHAGVGIFGHVYTVPEDRRKGAASILNERVMDHFRRADRGQAMYLNTGYDTPPFHIYQSCGFAGIEPKAGAMAWYATDLADFERSFFADGPTVIEPVDWPHWPTASPLFNGCFPGVARAAGVKLIGRCNTESPLLCWLTADLARRRDGHPPRGYVLRQTQTHAVLGIALLTLDPTWPWTYAVDVYCHPRHWSRAPELLDKLPLPQDRIITAWSDTDCPAQTQALQAAGFHVTATLPRRVYRDLARTQPVDLLMLER